MLLVGVGTLWPAELKAHQLTAFCAREGSKMDKFIARANITHLRDKLTTEQDEAKRQTLLRLLAEEEAKLATLENDPLKKKGGLVSILPFSPVCWVHSNRFACFRLQPPA